MAKLLVDDGDFKLKMSEDCSLCRQNMAPVQGHKNLGHAPKILQ